MGAPYIYDISSLRVKDLHSATYIYVVRRLRVKESQEQQLRERPVTLNIKFCCRLMY